MKTSVHFVNTKTKEGERKSVAISDDKGNLKYNFLIRLADDDALVWDKFSKKAFIEIAKEYRVCKKRMRKK